MTRKIAQSIKERKLLDDLAYKQFEAVRIDGSCNMFDMISVHYTALRLKLDRLADITLSVSAYSDLVVTYSKYKALVRKGEKSW